MTEEQIKQRANEYADKLYEDGRCTESTAPTIQEIYIAGAHSRDEEVEQLKAELDKAKNPWRESLPTEDDEYLVECGYYKCGELHVFHKTLYWKHDEWINECLGFVLRWMPIPKGGNV